MRVGLGEGGGNPQRSGGEHHRPADVAARAEHGVGAPPAQDPQARSGCDRGAGERADRAKRSLARHPLDAESVELEARVAGEPLLDRVRPTGERDEPAAPAERLGYRERGQDVTGRSSGGDQEPRLLTRRHG